MCCNPKEKDRNKDRVVIDESLKVAVHEMKRHVAYLEENLAKENKKASHLGENRERLEMSMHNAVLHHHLQEN